MRRTARLSKIFDVGAIVRVPFPFVEQAKLQARPALVVSRPVGPNGSLVWSLMITSARRGAWPGDVAVGDQHLEYGLPVLCYIRTAKIAALAIDAIERPLGRLPEALLAQVQERIRATLAL